MQPPGWPLPFGTPCAAKTFGGGHVVAVAGMNESMLNGELVKSLLNGLPLASVPEHATGCGGDVRFTSFCSRQVYAVPFIPICVICAEVAPERPFTPSQPPYRLSKLWFSR